MHFFRDGCQSNLCPPTNKIDLFHSIPFHHPISHHRNLCACFVKIDSNFCYTSKYTASSVMVDFRSALSTTLPIIQGPKSVPASLLVW
mmetsp:Transcript_49760/g.56349  ORF Transcript_49760/g.56349 Transcript_49760/m.56349 type:complete len:88 (+) Transcript_49760:252-515(+)